MHSKEEKLAAFGRLLDVQDRLRIQCPWDRKQTFESLRPNTIEETFELCDALMKRDYKNIKKELGDVLEHVMFYSIIGREDEEFDICDVCNQEADKLMFRHPFINWREEGNWTVANPDMCINEAGQVVYKETQQEEPDDASRPSTASAVEKTWEQIKQQEKDGNERVLSGVPDALPSLIKAYRIQDKARNVGFDWKEKEDVWDKVYEELEELKAELAKGDKENSTRELGDFLFSVINAARLYKLNPDNALEMTNQKFIRRFNYLTALYTAFEAGDTEIIANYLNRQLITTVSFHDARESFYHGFLLALLSTCATWEVSSNAETGIGRADIIVEREDGQLGFVIEIKDVRDRQKMDAACEAAMKQIEEKDYTAVLRRYGVEKIWAYGIAFCDKKCRIVAERVS